MKPYFYPAKLIEYNQNERTAQVHIQGLTDGSPNGLTALLAYPIGDDDLDTERELLKGADVWVFFENGDMSAPVIAFYRSHGKGMAVKDIRRIRQENIEVLARSRITLNAKDLVEVNAERHSGQLSRPIQTIAVRNQKRQRSPDSQRVTNSLLSR